MTYPRTVFDRPQADLMPDTQGERLYGNVSNALEVLLQSGKTFFVAIAVPSMIFTYMRQVMKVDPSTIVHLAVDYLEPDEEDDPGWYVLSIMAGTNLHDLWAYRPASLPQFLLNPSYRVVRG